MQYRRLGRTGLQVSVASLGTGGPSRLGQRTHGDEAASHRVVHRALELGINLIDSAANYSDSEAILGRALRSVPRHAYYIATKFAPDPAEDGTLVTPEQVVESCEQSLRRLGVETIDLYQFHGVVPDNYRECVQRLYPTVQRLKDQGKVRFIGVTEYFYRDPGHRMLGMAVEDDVWDTIMVKYGILNMAAAWRVLPMAQQRDIGVLNMSPVRIKLSRPAELERTLRRWKDEGHLAESALPDQDPLGFLVHDRVGSVVEAGYKFGVSHPAISTLLLGTGNVEHLEQNVATILGDPLPAADLERLHAIFGGLAESEGDTG